MSLGELGELASRLFVPRTFPGVKARLLGVVVLGIVIDTTLRIRVRAGTASWPDIDVDVTGTDAFSIFSALLTLTVLVAFDWLFFRRRQRLVEQLVVAVRDPDTSPETRAELVNIIVSHMN